jgi:hypothetical protein
MGILSSEHKSFMVVDFGGLKGVLTCSRSRAVVAGGLRGHALPLAILADQITLS